MKMAIAIATAGLISVGIAGAPAGAYTLGPAGKFTADGTTSATKGALTLPCNAHLTGIVNRRGVGYVTGATFTDNGAVGCAAVSLSGLWWKAVARTSRRIRVLNAGFNGPGGLTCGPGALPLILKDGVITFTAVPLQSTGGDCTVTGNLTTSPTLTIRP
jgi:hypothetical protein